MLNPNEETNKYELPRVSREKKKIYLSRRETDLISIRSALEAKNLTEIREIAHKIKGNSALFGFHRLGLIAAGIEETAANGSVADLRAQIAQFEATLREYIIEVSTLG